MERDVSDVWDSLTDNEFQPTLSAWRETLQTATTFSRFNISTHSLRMERDKTFSHVLMREKYFNPLSPHGERPQSARGSTPRNHFNPLSPHGERHKQKNRTI